MSEGNNDKKSVLVHVLKHPKQIIGIFNRANIKLFFSMAHYSGFKAAIKTSMSVMNNSVEDIRRLENYEEYTSAHNEIPEHIELPSCDNPLVSIVIPVCNQYKFTMVCIKSVEEFTKDVPYEVILGDDRSTDETVNIDKRVSNLIVVRNETNLGFTLNCNNAAKKARGKYILFLNNDTVVRKDWLSSMVELIESSDDIGIVGSKLLYPDGVVQEAGGIIWSDGTARNYGKGENPNQPMLNYVREVDYVSGASLLVRRDLFEQLGGFDSIYAPAYCEDSDLAMGVRKLGYRVMYQPRSTVIHFEGMTHGKSIKTRMNPMQITNTEKFKEKWAEELKSHCHPGTDMFHARERSMKKKSILLLTYHTPSSDMDSELRELYLILALLNNSGYNVKLASPDLIFDSTYMEPLQNMGMEVFYGGNFRELWKSELKKHRKVFEIIAICGYGCADRMIKVLDKYSKSQLVYILPNNPQLSLEREYDITNDKHTLMELASVKHRNPKYLKMADLCVTFTSADTKYVLNNSKIKIVQLPRLADSALNGTGSKHSKHIAFVGYLGNRANLDGITWFISNVMPLLRVKVPGIQLHIIGCVPEENTPVSFASDIIYEGHLSNEKVLEKLAQCSLCINPLRFGPGARVNLIDCMTLGIPIISTGIGMDSLENLDYPSFNSAEQMADGIMRTINHGEYWDELSVKGKEYVDSELRDEKFLEGVRLII